MPPAEPAEGSHCCERRPLRGAPEPRVPGRHLL